jgi:hypothetical protein
MLRTKLSASFALYVSVLFLSSQASFASGNDVTHTDFHAAKFTHSLAIDNGYLPLSPGTELTLEGTVNVDGSPAIHRVVFTVTDLSKKLDGAKSRVIYDVDSTAGVVTEAELAFMAEDDRGNIWNTGEYPEVFDGGVFQGSPAAWIGGVQDALPGVGMRARPRPGTSDYYQALVPSIEFGDLASIVGIVPKVCVPAGCFRDVLQIKETNTFLTEGFQMKYYAPGVGNIRIDFLGGAEQESLELVRVRKLRKEGLERVRKEALRLDHRAYHVAPDVYGDTPRAQVDRDS